MAEEYKRYRHLAGSELDWQNNDLIIGANEIVVSIVDGVRMFKIGDGTSTFTQLPYQQVTISTDQVITGEKTFTQTIQLQNQIDPTSFGSIYSTDFLGFHSIQLDGNEPNSSAYLIGRDPAGDPIILSVYQNGGLYMNEHLIADINGIHANTVARFNEQVLLYQRQDDDQGDKSEYFQLDVIEANGGNLLRVDSPFLDSEIIFYARDELGFESYWKLHKEGYIRQSWVMDDTAPQDALVTRAWVEEYVDSIVNP